MSPPGLAIGVGCRAGCQADAIVRLVEVATAGLDLAGARLFTLARKIEGANLREASRRLGLPLVGVSIDALEQAAAGVTQRSARVLAATGVPSVAEAAALAGAGPGARLIVARRADNGATCAVATATDQPNSSRRDQV